MKRRRDARAPDEPEVAPAELEGALSAAAPDVAADAHRRRSDLVRRRVLGGLPPRIGRFALLREVGSGATSVVYAAYDEELDRRIALKLLRAPAAAADERLLREAQAMARLSHPNVVAVHEIGTWEGQLFVAMELVEGETLEAWRAARHRTWQEIVEVFLDAGRGLAAAHAEGYVHRDFKPANVMVGRDGRARVLDFGLVRLAEEPGAPEARADEAVPLEVPPAGSGSLTATGACVGTPAYMAPEQRAGRAADARSDQFSFCVALHEALFGVRPGEAPALVRRSGVIRPRLSRVIERGLAGDPGARWPSMRHLLAELERLRWPARRWRQRAAVLGMAVLAAAAVLAARHLVARERDARGALEHEASHQRVLAHDARLVAAAQRLIERDPMAAAAALREVRYPDRARGWRSMATAVLLEPLSGVSIRNLERDCNRMMFDRGGHHLLALLDGGDLGSWRTDGAGAPVWRRAEPHSFVRPILDGGWAIARSADRAQVVLARLDGSARRTFEVPGEGLSDAIFTGADVIAVSVQGVVRRWRDGGPEVLGRPPRGLAIGDPSRWLFSLGWWGRHVLARSPSGERWVWRADGAGAAVRLSAGAPFRTRLSDDERWLGVTHEGGVVELWDLEAGGPPRTLRGHRQSVTDIDFSADGRRAATASLDGTARVWQLDGGGEPLVLRGHEAAVSSVRFAPDGERVVTGSRDRTARVWRLDGSGDVMVLRGHSHQVGSVAFSPDGGKVATCGLEPSIRIWDVRHRLVQTLGSHDDKIWSARPDAGGERLVTAGFDGTVRIWRLDGGGPPLVLRERAGSGRPGLGFYTALFSSDGSRVAAGGNDGAARIWRADGTGEPVVVGGHSGWVYGIAFTPDGRWLATGARDGELRLSPVEGDGAARVLERGCGTRSGSKVHMVVFGPRGDRLAADAPGCQGTPALLWIDGPPRRSSLGGAQFSRSQLAMSADGRIATGEKDGTVRVWSADGRVLLATLRGHDGEIHDLAFSRDGRRLLSASFDRSARLWDLDRPGEPIILRGHDDWVLGAAFDAAERRVVTASADGTARVWLLDEPDRPIVLRGHRGEVRYAGFTPAGRVATASHDGTVRLWSLDELVADPAALMARLRRATAACLTADQRMHYLEEPADTAAVRSAACERAAGRGTEAAPAPGSAAPTGTASAR